MAVPRQTPRQRRRNPDQRRPVARCKTGPTTPSEFALPVSFPGALPNLKTAPLVALLCGMLVLPACAPEQAPPSILLISIDTLRADHLSCYGHDRATPAIDALAAGGELYAAAYAAAPWTLPSHMSLFTGQYPSHHGVVDARESLPETTAQLPEALRRAGYRTAGFGAHIYLGERFGFGRGFDHYSVTPYRNDPQQIRRGDAVVDQALAWLEANATDPRPYFLFVHIFDPHWTYAAPEPWLGQYSSVYAGRMDGSLPALTYFISRDMPDDALQHVQDLYDEEIAWTDALVGRLVAGARAAGSEPLIALCADHGEEFKEHGSLGHAVTLYEEQQHVPLILAGPGCRVGTRVSAPVRTLDLVPTLARAAQVPAQDPLWASLDGVPLGRAEASLPVIMETTRWGPSRSAAIVFPHKALSPARYHWLRHTEVEGQARREAVAEWRHAALLFDLRQDPKELRPLPWDANNPAAQALLRWQEESWRGLLLELRTSEAFRARLRWNPELPWRDEVRQEVGIEAHEANLVGTGELLLRGAPDQMTTRIHLPIEPALILPLELSVEVGELRVLIPGEATRELHAGERMSIPKIGPGTPGAPAAGTLRLRARPYSSLVEAGELSEKERRILESLGYVDG